MRYTDYSPAKTPSLDQQRDALQKGLGRAMQWATVGHMDEALLLEACLQDWRFDVTLNKSHGDWLWQIMQAVHAEDRFRATIFEALNNLAEDNAAQLCQLGFHYAANGDNVFRSRLYQIVEEKPTTEMRHLGEKEIIRLDGEKALLFAVRLRGSQLENRDWEWGDDSVLIDEGIEQLGEDRVRQSLETVSDQDSRRFREAWIKDEVESEKSEHSRLSPADKMKQIPVADIIAAAESPENEYPYLRGWGRLANDNDLETALEHLLSSREPRIIANYLKIFSLREFPYIVPELIYLSQHDDAQVRCRVISALEKCSHPLIRELAEDELKKGVPDGLALGLFVKNYQDGDEQRIIELAQLPEDPEEQHWFLKDITTILEKNPDADCSQLGLAAYALMPCSFCRYYAAKLIRDRQVAPTWMLEECRYDVEENTRKLVDDLSSAN